MRIIIGAIFVVISGISVYAQGIIAPGVNESDYNIIQSQVKNILGATYYISNVINVDSSLSNRFVMDGAITDPYQTLKSCYLFIAKERTLSNTFNTQGVVGIYKNSAIIWNSGPLINSSLSNGSLISATLDLISNGRVEIVTSWFEGAKGDIERLWIFTWDGHNGNLINAVNAINESVLISVSSEFEYVDIDGDGVSEITGRWYDNENDDNKKKIIYCWNGSQYGKWTSAPQPLPSGFYPRNMVIATVKSSVTWTGDNFLYNYNLNNAISSKQMINEFLFATSPDSIINIGCMSNWVLGGLPGKGIGWILLPGFHNFIEQGESNSSFSFKCVQLPAIIQCFIRGENGSRIPMAGDSIDFNLDRWFDDVTTNSFKIKTIGPADPPNPFVPLNFLDTLTNYTAQSRILEWIKDQVTADKYLGYFSSAKTSLQQNNTTSTRAVLNQALQDVNIDSTNNITSEAYALIRYNTEYLLSQLPTTSPPAGCNVKLVSSTGTKLTGGTLQYYEGAWKDAVNNNDGTFFINTTKTSLSLRMIYEYGTQTKSNISISSDTVVFQTVNAKVQLQNSSGVTMDTGTVQYYAGAWRALGTTVNGTASKELLPNNYSFRMSYAYASNDKKQDLNTNSIVVFRTVNTQVQLQNSNGTIIDTGIVKYYSGAWREFGTTTNGVASKELLPNNYSFRMTYAYASNDKKQDLNTNPIVIFQTINAKVQLQNSNGVLIDTGTVKYYAGAWRDLGITVNGIATKELLAANYSFRMTYAYASKDKQQDISTNPIVVFQTVNAAVQLQNSQGALIDQGTVQYYSGAWREFSITTNGVANKELLPNNYSFRMTYAYASNDKKQDLNTNPIVVFQTVNAAVQLQNSQGSLIDQGTVQYYAGAWREFSITANGVANKELLPNNYSFRMMYENASIDKKQDLSTNNTVVFSTVLCTIRVMNSQNELIDGATASYYSGAWRQIGLTVDGEITKELLPLNLSFRVKMGTQQQDKKQDLSTNTVVEFTL